MIDLVFGGLSFLKEHPFMPLKAAWNAARMELSIPVDLLRWAIDRRPRGKGPTRIELFNADPALGLLLAVDLYGTELTVTSKVTVERVAAGADSLEVGLRVQDLDIKAPAGSPAEQMVKSMDLSRPANLMRMMPMKHQVVVSAQDDRFVIDLMKVPALARSDKLKRALGVLKLVNVRGVRASGDLVAVKLGLGLGRA